MKCNGRFTRLTLWLPAVLAVGTGSGLRAAQPAGAPATASGPAGEACADLRDGLAASEKALKEHGPSLRRRLEAVTLALKNLETQPASAPASELAECREKLIAEQTGLHRELRFLESAETAGQAALDACESAQRLRKELAQFQADLQHKQVEFVAGDVAAFQSQLLQNQTARAALDEGEAVRAQRLAVLAGQIEKADEKTKPALVAEQFALQAETESTRHKRAALDAQRALLEARLAAAGEALRESAAGRPAATSTAPAKEDEADALNKQRLAEKLEAEARNRLGYARSCLQEVQTQLTRAQEAGRDTARLEHDREYWQRRVAYEQRRLEQADLQQRAARETKETARLREREQAGLETLEQLKQRREEMSPEQRRQQAAGFEEQAAQALEDALDLERRAEVAGKDIPPLQQLLPSLDAVEEALRQRLEQAVSFDDYQRLSNHFRRMRERLDAERQQIDLMITMTQNISFALMRQATLHRQLADLYTRCAEVLVPPVPSFWERNRSIINSMKILAAVIAISYAVKLAVSFIRRLIAYLNATVARGRFSVKRAGTLLSFAGSIIKLFVWLFGVVWVLNEFGISPATATGALGLIGLIMAGMFQQIVVDFVKGLDIIAGRHYNVGDFVEVDGKFGHVVDFNVKYTRIRTGSGQEFNVPNSRCLPSRRFPDGYVDNYVDLTLKSSTDEARAGAAADPVCQDLNYRIEPIREVPALIWRFAGPQGRVTLRYRVRVLPGCDWVLKDYFLPAVQEALARGGIELAAEPTFFFINRIETFRKLFSRQLSEEEIVRETGQASFGSDADANASPPAAPGP